MHPHPHEDLRALLLRADGRGYKAYRQIKGAWALPAFTLQVDHVQGDPFAAPTRVRVFLSADYTGLPLDACSAGSRGLGTAALLARRFQEVAQKSSTRKGTGKSGEIRMEAPGQEVLRQTAVMVSTDGSAEARFTVGLPARGRRILGEEAVHLLLESVPAVVEGALRARAYGDGEILRHALANEDADALREALRARKLVAFVAEGAILPRRSGVSQEPMAEEKAVPFASPPGLRVEVDLPNRGPVLGMGIPEGVTLIVGGGYYGKSTLLRALERGVYNHRPGDGRELVVTDPAAVKIRAEDGRSIRGVDISPFIRDLPSGEDTRAFTSPNASGSTSQAANIVEALEAGARAILVDEDTAATNFMIRDRRMQALVPREKEPITPFVDRIRQLYEERGVSSVLVLGGSGDYLEAADTVIAMEVYRPLEVTARAKEVANDLPTGRTAEDVGPLPQTTPRSPHPSSLDPRKGRREENLKVRGLDSILIGREELDLSAVEQIVSWAQLNALGRALLLAHREHMDGERSIPEILALVEDALLREGLDVLDRRAPGDLAEFRRFELAAALNRTRSLRV
ncbi:MAG: ABC-ATPase domain-containing protein [Longimicrobiales bacterium]